MKIRATVTLDIDTDAWALEYGIDKSEVRADVLSHLFHTTFEHYVNGLGVAKDITVK